MARQIGYQLGIVLLLFSSLSAEPTNSETSSPGAILIPNDASELYFSLCADCHGPNGSPEMIVAELFDPPPPDFAKSGPGKLGPGNEEQIFSVIWNGRNGMPGFSSRLNKAQATRLSNYIKKLSERSGD